MGLDVFIYFRHVGRNPPVVSSQRKPIVSLYLKSKLWAKERRSQGNASELCEKKNNVEEKPQNEKNKWKNIAKSNNAIALTSYQDRNYHRENHKMHYVQAD